MLDRNRLKVLKEILERQKLLRLGLEVRLEEKGDEKISQGTQINDVDGEREKLALGGETRTHGFGLVVFVINKRVGGRQNASSDNLGDLRGCQRRLEDLGHPDLERRQRVVEVHDCVDEGVEDDKDPDGWGGKPDACPHGEHGSRMVVGLEHRRGFALGQNDHGVDHLVELGQIEPVAVVVEARDPQRVT